MADQRKFSPGPNVPDVSEFIQYMTRRQICRMQLTIEKIPGTDLTPTTQVVGDLIDHSAPSDLGLEGVYFVVRDE